MYLKFDGVNIVYPYNTRLLRSDNPQVSFPEDISSQMLAEWNVFPVVDDPCPFIDHTQNVEEVEPAFIAGSWHRQWKVTAASPEEIAERVEVQSDLVRSKRNVRLTQSDWTQLADAPVDRAAWAVYRESLRNLTKQEGFPWNVVWPEPPAQ